MSQLQAHNYKQTNKNKNRQRNRSEIAKTVIVIKIGRRDGTDDVAVAGMVIDDDRRRDALLYKEGWLLRVTRMNR